MQASTIFDPQKKCIITKFIGVLSDEIVRQSAEEIRKISAEHNNKRLLLDIREAKIQNNVMDYYRLPKKLYTYGIAKGWKRAVLVQKNQDKGIFETEYVARGLKVQICSDEERAVEWLGR